MVHLREWSTSRRSDAGRSCERIAIDTGVSADHMSPKLRAVLVHPQAAADNRRFALDEWSAKKDPPGSGSDEL
ncbi:MAG TPA: hypothetical protein VNI56_05610 [Xanthomonadaceae bacterium]|nr:hypothetical protein [Xanthomonadaceae bacterium]